MSDDPVTHQTQNPPHEEIARRARRRWAERGCPIGSPEEDWFRAEQAVRDELIRARNKAVREGEHFLAAEDKGIPAFSDHSGSL